MTNINTRLAALGIDIPSAPSPAANYVPYVVSDNLIYVSGQLPMRAGEVLYKGTLGLDIDIDTAYEGAKLCAVNILAQVKEALSGDLERVERVIRLGGFVASTPDFQAHPKVINGASDLMAEVFLEKGHHARAAVGVASLPLGVAVEIDAILQFK